MSVEQIISKHLGKTADGAVSAPYITPKYVDPSLLVFVPREPNRTKNYIDNSRFVGYDVWNCYEFSYLNEKGFPFNYIVKIVYDANSEFVVESKSLKLFLNSFNMTKFGEYYDTHFIENYIRFSLMRLNSEFIDVTLLPLSAKQKSLEECLKIPFSDLGCMLFDDAPSPGIEYEKKENIRSPFLRSNCLITNQPDWADVYVHSKNGTRPDDLYRVIAMMREENHFHEEACEIIINYLINSQESHDDLAVGCFYTRRGGIDINPIRAVNHVSLDTFAPYIFGSDIVKSSRQ